MDRAPRRRKIPMSVEENELARKQGKKNLTHRTYYNQ